MGTVSKIRKCFGAVLFLSLISKVYMMTRLLPKLLDVDKDDEVRLPFYIYPRNSIKDRKPAWIQRF